MRRFIKIYQTRFLLIIGAIIFRQLLLVIAQQLNAGIFNQLADQNIQVFLYILIGMIGVWIITIGLDAWIAIKEEKITMDIQGSIREDVANKMIMCDYAKMQTSTTGTYLSWLNNDVSVISQKGVKQIFNIARGISGVVFSGVLMIQYHWSLLLVTGLGFLSIVYIPRLLDQRVYQTSLAVSKGSENFVSELEDQIKGYPIYFAFSSLVQFVKRIDLASIKLKEIMMKQVRLDAGIVAVNFSINVFFQILLTFIAAVCYFEGWVQIGVVAIVGSLADIIFSGLGSVSYQYTSIKSVKPIFDKYDTLQEEKIIKHEAEGNDIYQADNLGLTYGQVTILNDVSFCISPGNKCLISGVSGSGKSSLIKLLLGYNKEFSGELSYKGRSIKDVSSKMIAKEILYLSQESYFFKGTVKENIQLGERFLDTDLLEVIRRVGFDQPQSMLDVDVSSLSGGQKQRLALARAIIRRPKVLICDEITSALDKESSHIIEDFLLEKQDLTVIMITHTLQVSQERFDKIITL